jgi:hypothetical protein
MLLPDLLGWAGNVCFVVGMILLARRCRWGFLGCAGGNYLYLVQSAMLDNVPLFILSIGLSLVNMYGLAHWSNK